MAKHRYRMNKFKTSPPSACKIRRHEAETLDLIKSGFSITSIHRDLQIGKGVCYYSELSREGRPSVSRWLTKVILGPYAPALLENYENEKLAKLQERHCANQTGDQEPSCSSYENHSADKHLYSQLRSKGYMVRKILDYRGTTSARTYKTQLSREENSEKVYAWFSRKMFVTDYENLLLSDFQKKIERSKYLSKNKPSNPIPSDTSNVNDLTLTFVRDKRFKSGFRPVANNEKPEEIRPSPKSVEVKSCEVEVQVDLIPSQGCQNCTKKPMELTDSFSQTELSYFVFDSVYCSKK